MTRIYFAAIHLVSGFNKKARQWVEGRKSQQTRWRKEVVQGPLIWFHAASLGEFEQGRPVLEAFRKSRPDWKILVTFFSPSGYEARKDYPLADYIYYLPEEKGSNINDFLDVFKPNLAVFIKYEFWYGYMRALEKRHTPLVFISSTFRKNQVFFKWYGSWFLKQLKASNHIFVQDESSLKLLKNRGIQKVTLSGDTRYDRVLKTVKQSIEFSRISAFCEGFKIVIFGSAWRRETDFCMALAGALPDNWKIIYAPHEIDVKRITSFEKELSVSHIRFSKIKGGEGKEKRMLIVDGIGYLSALYKYADIAVIGGGFTDGIHNILEPAAFGVPVFFGPNHIKFPEAGALIEAGCGFEIADYKSLINRVEVYFQDEKQLVKVKKCASSFVQERTGATAVISKYLDKLAQIISCQIS